MKTGTSVGIACAIGVAGGIVIGARAVKIYDWRTEWTIPAPMPFVYEAMTSRQAVREWWREMTTSRLAAPSLSGCTRPPRSHASLRPSASIAYTPT
jgi:hypothetical protein